MIPFQQVQQLENTKTVERFRPDIIVSTKNLTRGIRRKVREMSVCIGMFKNILSFRLGILKDDVKTTISHNDNIKYTVKLPSAYLLSNGHRIVIKENGEATMVIKCSYAITRVMTLRYNPSLKQHYLGIAINSIEMPRGEYKVTKLDIYAKECL
ncbi:hypothetical protein ColLi_12160 [Colletotrichum liriopes]|uniref:Uncharacterized protein n=1 Tax=Colletotrichum liriopes TaxID=708192 RepID=A0AA37LYE2_9PEZI|nr:hypothetical protein ColLi_12160 [Colletotrichum liriopes]